MAGTKDLTGQKFGRWTVLSRAHTAPGKQAKWSCRCDCGGEADVAAATLKNGTSKSCGCLTREAIIRRSTTHGQSGSPTYLTWQGMIARCTNPSHVGYQRYAKKGITVCERWLTSFENFIADMGEKPKGRSIDRIDNDKGYYPENCRWATAKQQCRNQDKTIMLTVDGVTKPLQDWADDVGAKHATIKERILNGWGHKDAVYTPVGTYQDNVRTRVLEFNGKKMHPREWAEELGISVGSVYQRLSRGWPMDRVLSKRQKTGRRRVPSEGLSRRQGD